MEKRVLLAVVLSFVVLYTYQALVPIPDATPPAASLVTPGTVPAASTQTPGSVAPLPISEAVEAPAVADALVTEQAERDIIVESDAVRAVFTNRGAVLKSWLLKRYRDHTGTPLDLIPQTVEGAPRPFTLATDDSAMSGALRAALFKASADGLVVGGSAATLSFEYRRADGLSVRKDFGFDPAHPFVISFTAAVTNNGAAVSHTVQWGPSLGNGIVESSMGTYNPPPQPVFYRGGSVTRVAAKDIAKSPNENGPFGFVGVDDHYFLTAALTGAQPVQAEFQPVAVPIAGSTTVATFVSWGLRYGAPAPAGVRYFLGPKDFDVLAGVDRDLVRSIDFGMFSVLVVPLLGALKWVNSYLGNYGWSIIALTVIINLVMFPLRHKSVVSMRKMQDLQPEVKIIQERYANLKMADPARQKMNSELMNLYRERGVNPASGCVPMLLTLPVLFAFYSMLSVAIELRGAPFVGWIHDLARHDPLFITPILMGITMVVQQRMTPSTADPMQQKMMMFMPLIFTFMFVWAPSGLVIYWTVSNLWAIGQQALTNRLIASPVRTARVASDTRLKNAGAGRTEAAKERK